MVVGTGLRITVSKDELVSALGVVSRAVSTRTSVQILSGILVEAQGSELRLAATDMELSLRATATAQIEGDGAIVLPGKTFADIARLLPAGEVLIEHKPAESVVHVTAGTASYTLHTLRKLPDPVREATSWPHSPHESIACPLECRKDHDVEPILIGDEGCDIVGEGRNRFVDAKEGIRVSVEHRELGLLPRPIGPERIPRRQKRTAGA